MTFYRPLHKDNDQDQERPLYTDPRVLDYLEIRRQTIIQELRQIDNILIENGRRKAATLSKRIR